MTSRTASSVVTMSDRLRLKIAIVSRMASSTLRCTSACAMIAQASWTVEDLHQNELMGSHVAAKAEVEQTLHARLLRRSLSCIHASKLAAASATRGTRSYENALSPSRALDRQSKGPPWACLTGAACFSLPQRVWEQATHASFPARTGEWRPPA